jgi:hypothetical protein
MPYHSARQLQLGSPRPTVATTVTATTSATTNAASDATNVRK